MAEYVRARSDRQKTERFNQVKAALEHQFSVRPYHEISLATLAEELGWSRTNLYKYASTKEEVFLAVFADKRDEYMDALVAAMPSGCGFDNATIANVWSGIAAAHRDFFRYGDLLYSVIETNVGVEKLKDFKQRYYDELAVFAGQMAGVLGIAPERVEAFTNTVYHQGVGLAGSCTNNPLVVRAIAELGIAVKPLDFQLEMRDFVAMTLAWYQSKEG